MDTTWQSYEIGTLLDVFDQKDSMHCWGIATIVNIHKHTQQIEVEWYGQPKHRTLIDVQTKNKDQQIMVSPLHSHTTQMVRFDISPDMGYNYSTPLFYKKNYIVIASEYEVDPFVYKYDIRNQKWIKFAKYPPHFKSSEVETEIDESNELLYLFGGFDNCFATLHLETAKWTVLIDDNDINKIKLETNHNNDIDSPLSPVITKDYLWVMFDANNGELYLLNKHKQPFRFDKDKLCLIGCKTYDESANLLVEQGTVTIFVPILNMFMVFGGWDHDFIHCCSSATVYDGFQKWEVYDGATMPHKTSRFQAILAYEKFIFLFYYWSDHNREIWILNLMDHKWFKSNETYPGVKAASIMNTFDNDIHFFSCAEYKRYHLKMDLLQFIPDEMIVYYKRENTEITKLVDGFIRMEMQMISNYNEFPMGIRQYILSFYPLFLYY